MSADLKDRVRSSFRRQRRELGSTAATAGDFASAAAPLLHTLPASSQVACYLPMGSEPDTSRLLEDLFAAGHTVLVPVCEPERQLSWRRWAPGTELAAGLFPGIPEPVGPRLGLDAVKGLDLLFIPALAADAAGTRMGKGGGYYDRFLARFRAAGGTGRTVAVVYDHEFLPAGELPADALDAPVDGILTPSGFKPVPSSGVYT
ncbi:5-formyltetrahydrofolate cyclo-ligase [Arthrobacter sp. Sa2BUA2]|uniref:5-formyltetrahydrofolate cyclo-ligase n=1 Tax=Arthrobacter pullicola TaxID=2762224 RepID=A0ABR8YIL5_9MICC|nr:5-formyltetrahydrofolate cyclo-ligase [Arthrobacter pullicola]MBD8044071.1 5-formyltetrahydrofolate cyclo-ligase [Arthrobacter pullicola]